MEKGIPEQRVGWHRAIDTSGSIQWQARLVLSVRFREMRTNKTSEIGEFVLPRTRIAHAQVYVCECIWIWGLLQSFSSGQTEAVLYLFSFFFLKQKSKIPKHWTPLFTYTVPNLSPCCMSQPGLLPEAILPVWDKRTGRLGLVDIRELNGDMGLPSYPSMTSHPLLAVVWPVSPGLPMARWDAVGGGGTQWRRPSPPHPNPHF